MTSECSAALAKLARVAVVPRDWRVDHTFCVILAQLKQSPSGIGIAPLVFTHQKFAIPRSMSSTIIRGLFKHHQQHPLGRPFRLRLVTRSLSCLVP